MSPITVFQTFNPAEAQLVWSRLEAAGFHPVVQHENAAFLTSGTALTTGGVHVQVPDNEAEEARALLASTDDDSAEPGNPP